MALLLEAPEVEACAVMPNVVNAIEQGLREEAAGHAQVPPRLNIQTPHGFFRMMGAVMSQSGLMGYKVFHGSIKAGVRYTIAIHQERDGALLALMDGAYLTAVRTGATTGVATRWMADASADTVAVIGSGLEAQENLAGVCAVRPIRRVRVFSPRKERREAFADRMSQRLGIAVKSFEAPELCIEGAPIVVVATNTGASQAVAFRGEWMCAGVHVNSVGSTMAGQREVDPDTFYKAAHVVIDTRHAQQESGDFLEAIRQNKYPIDRAVELADVVAGKVVGRTSSNQITLFKSVGTALQDVMGAFAVYQEAVRRGIGRDVGDFPSLRQF
jgi:ornithine cyclodeaminase/alanine dehydrogenase-like protein (mu-crystallin family)